MPLGGLLLLVAGLSLWPITETDLFFRLAAGREFVSTGSLVHQNLFSFTYPSHPYPDPAWLFDVGAYAMYRLGGFPALVLAKTGIILLTFSLAYRLALARGARPFPTVLLLGLAAFAMAERWVERPHLFTLLGCVVFATLLPMVSARKRMAFCLIPITILWVNLHAGAFLAPVLVGLAALAASLARDPAARRYWGGLPLVTLCLFLTPVGTDIVRYLNFHTAIFAIHPVDEFRGLSLTSDGPLLACLALCGVILIRVRPPLAQSLPALFFTLLTVRHIRFMAEAALFAALAAAPSLTRAIPERFRPLEHRFRWIPMGVFAVAVFFLRFGNGPAAGSLNLDPKVVPQEALAFVEKHGLRDRMYNDFETGSYLVWQGYPRYRVFVDPRLPAYPMEFHALLGRMDLPQAEWTQAMDRLGVESALLDYAGINRRVAYWDPEAYALVFRAQDTRVFLRRLPKWQGFILAHEIPATFAFSVEEGARTLPLPAPPKASPVPACEWHLRLADLYFDLAGGEKTATLDHLRQALAFPTGCLASEREHTAAAYLGSMDLKARRFEDALRLLDRALAHAPDDAALRTNRALALTALGRPSDAQVEWRHIARIARGTPLGDEAAKRASGK